MSFLIDINERDLFFHGYVHITPAGDHDVSLALPHGFENPGCAAFRDIFGVVPYPVGNPPHIILCAFVRTHPDYLDTKLLQSGNHGPALDATGIQHRFFSFQNLAVRT
ncbi:hypothetical protein D3C80_1788770 [compost metagenome]